MREGAKAALRFGYGRLSVRDDFLVVRYHCNRPTVERLLNIMDHIECYLIYSGTLDQVDESFQDNEEIYMH